MTDREATAGRCLMVGIAGPRLSADEREALEALGPGGAILFRGTWSTRSRPSALLEELRGLLAAPTALGPRPGRRPRQSPRALDRSRRRPRKPSPLREPRSRGASPARPASAVRGLGFNVDFAPVVDLCPPGTPNGIGGSLVRHGPRARRTLGRRLPRRPAGRGVAGCLKHFPGLGDTRVDAHLELPLVDRLARKAGEEDLLPYRRLHAARPA